MLSLHLKESPWSSARNTCTCARTPPPPSCALFHPRPAQDIDQWLDAGLAPHHGGVPAHGVAHAQAILDDASHERHLAARGHHLHLHAPHETRGMRARGHEGTRHEARGTRQKQAEAGVLLLWHVPVGDSRRRWRGTAACAPVSRDTLPLPSLAPRPACTGRACSLAREDVGRAWHAMGGASIARGDSPPARCSGWRGWRPPRPSS